MNDSNKTQTKKCLATNGIGGWYTNAPKDFVLQKIAAHKGRRVTEGAVRDLKYTGESRE